MTLPSLRHQLAALLPPLRAGIAVIPTGITPLDRVLSDGGLPSGRLTEILGRRGSGRTTLVRQLVTEAVAARRWVAVVDGSRTLAPRDWAAIGDSGRLWVVRPPDPDRGAWCADILLRSGAFSVVVLDGALALPRHVAVRLTRLAREQDVVLVVAGEEGGVVGRAVRLRITRRAEGRGQRAELEGKGERAAGSGARRQVTTHDSRLATHNHSLPAPRFPLLAPHESRITITIEKGGTHHSVEVSCAIDMARRLCSHPEVPDRRGVAKRNRRGERISSTHRRPHTGAEGGGQRAERAEDNGQRAGSGQRGERTSAGGGTLARKRRCAEPLVRRDEFLLIKAGCR